MKICKLTDCDCNVDGYCTDWFSHTIPSGITTVVESATGCLSYNPVDKEGVEDADRN